MPHVRILLVLIFVFSFGALQGCGDSSSPDAQGDNAQDMTDPDYVADEGGGNPWDQDNPGEYVEVDLTDPAKSDLPRYDVPDNLPILQAPQILVSLDGLSVELIDDATGFHKTYPTGVGAKGTTTGKSYTPVGEFTTGPDTSDFWYYWPRRYNPEYFGGLPFLRLTAENHSGYHTYGFHGPITDQLIRGFVSHGCMRMQPQDILELFYLVREHPGTPVKIQEEPSLDESGNVIDVTPLELDPVATHRAGMGICEADRIPEAATIEPGLYNNLSVCETTGKSFSVVLEAGQQLDVEVTSAALFTITLVDGELETSFTKERAGTDTLSYTPDAATEVQVTLTGDMGPFKLRLTSPENTEE